MKVWLVCISIASSLIGLFVLLLLRPDVSPQSLSLTGEVVAVNSYPDVSFIEFIPDNLTVVSFSKPPELGRQVLYGRLKQYKGNVEFVVDD